MKVESEDDFEPEPSKSPPKRATRSRKSAAPAASASTPAPAPAAAPRRRGRPKKNADTSVVEAPSTIEPVVKTEEEEPATLLEEPTAPLEEAASTIEPTEMLDPNQTVPTIEQENEQENTPRKPSPTPRKPRRSVAPRAGTKSATPESVASASAGKPKPSPSPAPSQRRSEPLADITASSVNEKPSVIDETQTAVKPIRAMDTIMEKPMDIVLKSRTMALPVVEDTTPKPRLVITYLILTNFKSYAGRQEVGPFHGSFSSVVGPNGSGKSNVIDSLLFVFGFRASKMRQGKLSALIHNSAQYPNLDYCEVSVHFREVMDQVSRRHSIPVVSNC